MDAFDADVLIYAASPGHPLGRRVVALFGRRASQTGRPPAGVGSVLLLPELLTRPTRDAARAEIVALAGLLSRLDLRPVDAATARLAVSLGATYKLGAADAVHLATAVLAGADRFVTNNQRDFSHAIAEVTIIYPAELNDPRAGARLKAPV